MPQMISAQRISIIKNILSERNFVTIAELRNALNVSSVTIRKDLDILESQGFLTKSHGGATLVGEKKPDPVTAVLPAIDNFDSKRTIAELAADLVQDGDSVFIGSGSTCYVLAMLLSLRPTVSIVTNNITAANGVVNGTAKNLFIGGEITMAKGMYYTSGVQTQMALKSIYVNKAFLGLDGIDTKAGFTSNFYGDVLVAQAVADIAKEVILLADHTKFGKVGIHRFFSPENVNCVVSNLDIKSMRNYFEENSIRFVCR